MGGQQRIYKQRIASTQTLGKVFRAMEMIARQTDDKKLRKIVSLPQEDSVIVMLAVGNLPHELLVPVSPAR